MPEEDRVFDVTKPKDVSPPATSKPVIVGHHPMASDPMVKNADKPAEEPTHIKIIDESDDKPAESSAKDHAPLGSSPVPPDAAAIFSEPPAGQWQGLPVEPEKNAQSEPAGETPSIEQAVAPQTHDEPAVFPEAPDTEPKPAAEPAPPDDQAAVVPAVAVPAPRPHIEELHFSEKNVKRAWWKPAIIILLILLIGAYLAIDSGLISAGINLPFHVFKQKTSAAPNASSTASTPPSSQPAASTPSIPAGFKDYQLSGTNLNFAAPLAWGAPTSTADPGYSKRGTGQQSDGTHAYLVNFASNKDIQLAVTSSKYLPPVRSAQYYDYLQWCTGTNDGQIYLSTLQYTATAGVDTPSTIVCNQGPLTDVTKLDSKTIVQAKATDSTGKVLGDIYTKNLTDPTLVVFRVKDAAMTNGDVIKQLLSTVQFSSSQ